MQSEEELDRNHNNEESNENFRVGEDELNVDEWSGNTERLSEFKNSDEEWRRNVGVPDFDSDSDEWSRRTRMKDFDNIIEDQNNNVD